MRVLQVCLIWGAILVMTSDTFGQISAEQTIGISRQLIDGEDYALAVQYLGKAVAAKPYLAEPYYLRGLSKMMLGDYTGAIADCTTAIDINPYMRELYRVRGLSRLQLAQDSAAVADFRRGLELLPDDKLFLYYNAVGLDKLGDRALSRQTFEKLQRLYPQFTPAFTAQARAMLAEHDTTAALKLLRDLPGMGTRSAEATLLRADIAMAQKNWDEAVSELDMALRLIPHSDALYVNRGVAREHMGDKVGAMADFHAALEINPANKEAIENITGKVQVISPMPMEKFTNIMPGRRSIVKGGINEDISGGLFALTFTHPYNDLHPLTYRYGELSAINISGHFPSPLYLSGTASATPDAEQAVALFAYSEREMPSPTKEQLLGRAVAFAMLKNYESALGDLNKIIENGGDMVLAYLERAFVYACIAYNYRNAARRGERDERITNEALASENLMLAISDLDKVLTYDPEMQYALYDRGVLATIQGDYDKAMADYDAAIRLNPKFAQAYLNRGIVNSKKGNLKQAREDWSRAGELGLPNAYYLIRAL